MAAAFQIALWLGVVLAGIAAMQVGASKICSLLDLLRARWALPAATSGVFIGLATASPEISVNVASVVLGWPDLGLGAALGSNVPALPLIFLVAYLSSRFARKGAGATPAAQVKAEAVRVQVLPYLLVVLLLGVLTLPPAWAGLQPLDGLLLMAAYGLYAAHAMWAQPRGSASPLPQDLRWRVVVWMPVIALGALASVVASRRLIDLMGISDLVGGIFVIGLLCALPESFAAWRLAGEQKTTMAVSGAVGDGIVSLTIALVPPALAGATVGNAAIYLINLVFLAGTLTLYIALNHYRRGQELELPRVSLLTGGYAVYLVATIIVLNA